jgi:hypothetical protein
MTAALDVLVILLVAAASAAVGFHLGVRAAIRRTRATLKKYDETLERARVLVEEHARVGTVEREPPAAAGSEGGT